MGDTGPIWLSGLQDVLVSVGDFRCEELGSVITGLFFHMSEEDLQREMSNW